MQAKQCGNGGIAMAKGNHNSQQGLSAAEKAASAKAFLERKGIEETAAPTTSAPAPIVAESLISGKGPDSFRVDNPEDLKERIEAGEFGISGKIALDRTAERRLLTAEEAKRFSTSNARILNSLLDPNISDVEIPQAARAFNKGAKITTQSAFDSTIAEVLPLVADRGLARIAHVRAALGPRVERASFDRFLQKSFENEKFNLTSGESFGEMDAIHGWGRTRTRTRAFIEGF